VRLTDGSKVIIGSDKGAPATAPAARKRTGSGGGRPNTQQ
jgi:hypothetical protein